MKNNELIVEVLKKHKFQKPVSAKDQSRILKSKKKALKHILRQQKTSSLVFPLAFNLYYWLKNHGFSISFKRSVRLTYASFIAATVIAIITTSLFLPGDMFRIQKQVIPVAKAHIIHMSGDVSVVDQKLNKQSLSLNLVPENKIITTGNTGKISLQLPSVGVVTLLPNTKAHFSYIDHKKKIIQVALTKGCVFSNIIKNFGGEYKIKTPLCFAIARGTQYLTTYKNNKTEVKLLNGIIGIRTPQNPGNDTTLLHNNKATISVRKNIDIKPIQKTEKIALQKLSLRSYIKNIKMKTDKDLHQINNRIRKQEKQLLKQLQQATRPDFDMQKLSPLERLKLQKKPLTMLHLRDSSRIAGFVKTQTSSHIILDTGDGIIKVPIDEVVRRFPLQQ